MKIATAILLSAIGFLLAMTLIAELWAAIYLSPPPANYYITPIVR